MEMKQCRAGKLRAIGYEARSQLLRVELEDGSAIEYAGVGAEVWRRLSTSSSSSTWSYYRDHIEEEFLGKRGAPHMTGSASASRAALDDLFKPRDD